MARKFYFVLYVKVPKWSGGNSGAGVACAAIKAMS